MVMKRGMAKALEATIKNRDDARTGQGRKVSGRVFSSKARRRIFSILTFHPCLGASSIAKQLGISSNTVLWHLERLAASGFVIERRAGRRRLFWPEGLLDGADIEMFRILADDTSRRMVRSVIETPGIFQREVADKLGLSHQGVSSRAGQLREAGIINTVSEGVHIRYYITTRLMKRSRENYERAKAFKMFTIDRLDAIGEEPEIIRSSQNIVMIEIGPMSDRRVLEIGLDPYISVLAPD